MVTYFCIVVSQTFYWTVFDMIPLYIMSLALFTLTSCWGWICCEEQCWWALASELSRQLLMILSGREFRSETVAVLLYWTPPDTHTNSHIAVFYLRACCQKEKPGERMSRSWRAVFEQGCSRRWPYTDWDCELIVKVVLKAWGHDLW